MPALPVGPAAHAHAHALADPTGPTDEQVRAARRNLIGLYFLTGVAVATWLARLPSIRSALDLSTASLGTVLVVGSVGSLVMVIVAGGITNRWGSARTLMVAAAMFSVANVLVGLGPAIGSVPVLAIGMLISSSSYALANVPLNLESVVIERAVRRTVVPQFHAAFSVGSVVGSLVGAGISWLGVPVVWHFIGLSVVTFAWRWYAVPGAVLAQAPDLDSAPVRRGAGMRTAFAAWREPRTLLIGLVVFVAAISEGSANNWLSIAVVDGFAEAEAVGAVIFGVFVGAMTVARLSGARLIDRFGRVAVLVASGASSLIGLLVFGLAPSLATAAIGAAAWGLGTGLMVPIGMAAVSGDRLRMAGRVSVVSSFSSVASLAAPPLIGLAATGMGTRHALLLIGGGFVLSMAIARVVGTPAVADVAAPSRPEQAPDAARAHVDPVVPVAEVPAPRAPAEAPVAASVAAPALEVPDPALAVR